MMFTCPHCDKKTISLGRRFFFSWFFLDSCPFCGGRFRRSIPHVFAAIAPFLAAAFAMDHIENDLAQSIIFNAAWAASILLYFLWVPLVKRTGFLI